MSSCGTSSNQQYSYGGNCSSQQTNYGSGCSSQQSRGSSACYNIVYSYQSSESCQSQTYIQSHHGGCGGSTSETATSVALADAAKIGAGVQGAVGCTLDANGPVGAPQLGPLPAGDNADGDSIILTGANNNTTSVLGTGSGDTISIDSGSNNILVTSDLAANALGDTLMVGSFSDAALTDNNNILVAGNAANDFLQVGSGDNNVLYAGSGAFDTLIIGTGDNNALTVGDGASNSAIVGTGNNNDLTVGNGDDAFVFVSSGDNNCMTAGNGADDFVWLGTGMSNSLTLGNGANGVIEVDTGDNNLMTAGSGAGDQLTVFTGDHNSLIAGNGAGDVLTVHSGDYNFLRPGDGAGDSLTVNSGDYNALIAGSGAGDSVVVDSGDHNILATGDGNGDFMQVQVGGYNTILEGNGTNDTIYVDSGVNFTNTGTGNAAVLGNGDGNQAFGGLGDGNIYVTGAGNDLVHTGGGADFVYVDNHTEQSAAAMADPFHLTTQDSLAQNLYADGGNDTFIIQGTQQNTCYTYSSWCAGNSYSTAVSWQSELKQVGGDAPGLGTEVMTGGGGVEKYWFSDQWGNAVITDFNSAHGDRIMLDGVFDGNLNAMGAVHMQYIHSAYDTANTGAVDLLITFGSSSNISQSITLIDFKPQDTGGAGGTAQFSNVTFNNPAAAEATLAHIFDFSQADNAAVVNEVAQMQSQHLILH